MIRIRYAKADGLVTYRSYGKVEPVEGFEIAEVSEFPQTKSNQHVYYRDGKFDVVELEIPEVVEGNQGSNDSQSSLPPFMKVGSPQYQHLQKVAMADKNHPYHKFFADAANPPNPDIEKVVESE